MSPSSWLIAPEWWPALFVAPVYLYLALRADAKRAAQLAATVGPRVEMLVEGRTRKRQRMRRWIGASGLFLLTCALLQPVWGERPMSLVPKGLDTVVVLDVSKSMLATDISPSRLEWARQATRELASVSRGDRLGLIAFAGSARIVAPLTQDMAAVTSLLDEVDTTSVTRGGTDVGLALETALSLLTHSEGESTCVILLTDGEDIAGTSGKAVQLARERGIPVHVVAVGTPDGAKIPTPRGFLTDRNGNDVVTIPNVEGLTAIARATGGSVADVRREGALKSFYEDQLVPRALRSFEARGAKERRPAFAFPLVMGLLLLAWELGRSDRDPRRMGAAP